MEELTMARSNFAWEENMYKSELEEVSNYNAQQRNAMHVPPPCSPSYSDIVSHHTRSNVQHSTTEVDACCRFEGATADFTVAPQSTTQSATDTIPNSFEAADLSTTVSEIDGTSSMQLQTPGIFSASLSICTDFMGQSRTHSLSNSYAGSQPSSCCTSPRILPVHDLVQHFEDNSDTVSEVDCTLSLGTAATRKREWSHTRTQMSRCGSPARVADNGSSRFMFLWPPASSGPKLIDSSLHSTYQNLEQFVNRRSHEDHFSGHLGLDGVSKTRSFCESHCRIFYPGCKDMLSSQRTWTPSLGESQVFNEAILNLLPSNRGSEFLSPLRPTYSTNQCSANPGSMLQFATGKTLIDQCNVPRTCAHCGTSKTPLWRNGPMGPKSLCNACGIRYKKVGRRACSYARS